MATITAQAVKRMRDGYGLKVYTRRQWVLDPRVLWVYRWRRKHRKHFLLPKIPADTLWAHISVTYLKDGDRWYTMKEIARQLHNIGVDRFNSGISYNLLLHPITGELALGQALDAKGTHTVNDKRVPGYHFDQNGMSLAICVVGYPGVQLSKVAQESFAKASAALQDVGALTRGHDFNPHSMVAFKDCPTDAVRNKLDDIQHRSWELRRINRRRRRRAARVK